MGHGVNGILMAPGGPVRSCEELKDAFREKRERKTVQEGGSEQERSD